ncbi:MAG: M23 family metallopeptidase [Alphaproteobacteria bacterium]
MSNKYAFLILIFLFSILAPVAQAQDTKFIFPLACTYTKDCWAVNYVDVDASKHAKDFRCNKKSYDGHKGTDFALGSITQMRSGVDVLAAASGTVLRVRDGESDHLKTSEELDDLKSRKKECGNGILIDHGNGLQTIYCHLKKDSIVVKPEQPIKVGEKIAQVGQSGLAEFPHLHFGVIRDDHILDPYTGLSNTKECGTIDTPLWHETLNITYNPVAIFDGGFRNTAPDFERIKRGQDNPKTLPIHSAALVFWIGLYNVEEGDQVTLTITDPNGKLFTERKETVERTRARQYYYIGRKIGHVQLIPGQYKGHVVITRTDASPSASEEKIFLIEMTQ